MRGVSLHLSSFRSISSKAQSKCHGYREEVQQAVLQGPHYEHIASFSEVMPPCSLIPIYLLARLVRCGRIFSELRGRHYSVLKAVLKA